MNTGIQDGYNLAWKLAAVLKQGAPKLLLETYNEERLPNAKRLLATTDRIFDFAASDEWFISFVRKNVFPYVANFALSFDAVKQIVFPLVSQIGISYRKSSLSETLGSFTARAGDRMPWFEIDGRSIYDDFHQPMFHLLVFSDGATDIPPLHQWSDRIDSHFYSLTETVKNAFGCGQSFFLMLRPDNYIGLLSDNFSPELVAKYLAKFS